MYKLASSALAITLERSVEKKEIDSKQAEKAFAAIGDVLVSTVDHAGQIGQME